MNENCRIVLKSSAVKTWNPSIFHRISSLPPLCLCFRSELDVSVPCVACAPTSTQSANKCIPETKTTWNSLNIHELHMRNFQEQNMKWFWINMKHHEMPKKHWCFFLKWLNPQFLLASKPWVFYKSLALHWDHHQHKNPCQEPSFDNLPPLLASKNWCHVV